MNFPHSFFGIAQLIWTFLCKSLEAIISVYISFVIILPICIITGLINESIRAVISTRLRNTYGGQYALVKSTEDNIWSLRKPGNSRNILLLTIFDDVIDAKAYKHDFEQRVLNHADKCGKYPYDKLRQIFTVAFGYCCWKRDDNFMLDHHIRTVEPKVRPFFTESDLFEILTAATEDMSDDHPQWEEIILSKFVYSKDVPSNDDDGVDGGGGGDAVSVTKPSGKIRSAKIFRFHHAYMDQVSALMMMTQCMVVDRQESQFISLDKLSAPLPFWDGAKAWCNLILFGGSNLLRNLNRESSCFSQLFLPEFAGRKIHSWSPPVDAKVLAEIRQSTGCSNREILCSALGGALRLVSEKYCRKPPWLIFRDTFEDSVFLGMPSPIVPFPSELPVNRFGITGLLLNTEDMTSRHYRLKSVRDALRCDVAGSPVFRIHYWIMYFLGRLPARVIKYFLVDSGAPVLFHNLPWLEPVRKFGIFGNQVEEFAVWMPLVNCTGLSISACAYADSIRISGVGESSRVSAGELEFILNQMYQEILILAEESCGLNKHSEERTD